MPERPCNKMSPFTCSRLFILTKSALYEIAVLINLSIIVLVNAILVSLDTLEGHVHCPWRAVCLKEVWINCALKPSIGISLICRPDMVIQCSHVIGIRPSIHVYLCSDSIIKTTARLAETRCHVWVPHVSGRGKQRTPEHSNNFAQFNMKC